MAANDLSFNQISTVLNAIATQATGQQTLAPVDTASFITVANTTLKTGYDQVVGAISQVLDRTIFSIRPYDAKFGGLTMTQAAFGNHTRKINYVDNTWDDSKIIPLTDGTSIDAWEIKKPKVLQTNYYGQNIYQDHYTIFDEQLDVAFRGPDELASFWSGVTSNMSDRIEQAYEIQARAALANFVGGKVAANNGIVHLLTEYNAATGLNLTAVTVMQPANFKPFVEWVRSRVGFLVRMLTERSALYHINVTGKPVMRHTPFANQKFYLSSQWYEAITAMAYTDAFQSEYLQFADNEQVNYWQAIDTPDTINVTASYIDNTGAVVTADPAQIGPIFGVIFDDEAVGMAMYDERVAPAPYNPAGGYNNVWLRFRLRHYNDFSENGLVLLLD
jgi:hypothetical protein